MNLSHTVLALIAALSSLVNQLAAVLSCRSPARIDSTAHLDYRGLAFVFTSSHNYYIISDESLSDSQTGEYHVTGKLPDTWMRGCDATVIKDIEDCERVEDNEHVINCVQLISGQTKYISFDISAYLRHETTVWSEIKLAENDLILSNSQIDLTQKIDAIFNTDATAQIFIIQGIHYWGVEFRERCLKSKEQITVHEKRLLSDLHVFGRIDTAYYEAVENSKNAILYLFQYDHMQYYKIIIDVVNSYNGILISVNTTKHSISTHPIVSKICSSDTLNNSSHLTAEHTSVNIISNNSPIKTFSRFSMIIVYIMIFLFLDFI